MKKIVLILLTGLLFVGCQQKTEKSTSIETTPTVTQTDVDLEKSLEAQEDLKLTIIALSKKKDSLQGILKSTTESMTRINESKIDKGIEGVNAKLNELKGQKENFEEQVNLQKKEMDLAIKKIDLLKQEKVVYDEQRKALFDKGAAPKDFVVVDSLLKGISTKLNDQNKRVKALNRSVADVEEQVLSITEKRGFLSTKIRENYNAQEIFTEFAKEEESKIKEQIAKIDSEISRLSGNVSDINSTVAGLNDDIATQTATESESALKEADAAKTKNRLTIAAIAIVVIAVIFGLFYMVGKRNKNKKIKK
jgi:chromosome segregation ATPase